MLRCLLLLCLSSDDLVPLNDGCFRNIEVITRPGSLVDAQYPSPVVAGNTETSQRIVDAVFGALAKAIPDRIPAASAGSMSSLAIGAVSAPMWTYYETIPGGVGGGPQKAGESAVQTHMTNTLNTPAEALEMQYPMRVRRFEIATNTGGAGHSRGWRRCDSRDRISGRCLGNDFIRSSHPQARGG